MRETPRRLAAPALTLAAALALGGCGDRVAGDTAGATERVPAPPSGATRVWAIGDGADGSEAGRRLARRAIAERPSLFLYLGDVYDSGTDDEFATRYEPAYGALAPRTVPTPGNHEWRTRAAGYFRFWRAKRGGRALPPWFAVRRAGWEILSLNSEQRPEAGSPQLRWLGRRLRARRSTCRIALMHRPRYSAGRHGDQRRVRALWAALRGDARLVLSGHDHDSQQLRPDAGLTQLVAGAGGNERYDVDRDHPRLLFGDDDHFAGLRLELAPGVARFAFVTAEGRVLHRGTARCDGSFAR